MGRVPAQRAQLPVVAGLLVAYSDAFEHAFRFTKDTCRGLLELALGRFGQIIDKQVFGVLWCASTEVPPS